MPLMNRTVREDSGAWSLLKNAAVRARETARSFASTCALKFPATRVGADGLRYTPKTLPERSTTVITMVLGSAACAALCTSAETSAAVRLCTEAGGGADVSELVMLPQLAQKQAKTAANPKNIWCVNCDFLILSMSRPMRGR